MMSRVVGENKMGIYNPNNRSNQNRKDHPTNNKDKKILSRKRVIQQQSEIQKEANSANMASIVGNWIEAAGAIITAIASTPSKTFTGTNPHRFKSNWQRFRSGRNGYCVKR